MNIALKNSHAACRAPFCVRSSVAAVLLGVSLLGGGVVRAGGEPGQQQQQQRRDDGARFNDNRGGEQRDGRADERHRAMQERGDAARRNGRLTPDERRDLRRQINEAGQDIYSTPPRR